MTPKKISSLLLAACFTVTMTGSAIAQQLV